MAHINSPAHHGLLAPVAHGDDEASLESRPVSPISIASSHTRVASASGRASASSLATVKGQTGNQHAHTKDSKTILRDILHWWPEMLSILASMLFFIALVIFLSLIERTRLDKWQMFWHIQPSAIVSILITACQMSLTPILAEGISQLKWIYFEQRPQRLSDFETFDEASRGPWGQLRLIFRLRWQASVASTGALLALLALGLGPFTQQVLYTGVLQTPSTGPVPTIRAAHLYNSGALSPYVGLDESSPARSNTTSNSDIIATTSLSSFAGGQPAYATPQLSSEPSTDLSNTDKGTSTRQPQTTASSESQFGAVPPTYTNGGAAFSVYGTEPLDGLTTETTASTTLGSGTTQTSAGGISPPSYTPQPRRRDLADEIDAGGTACANTRMIRAAYIGLFTANTNAAFSCPSGNCTWPAFTSLGLCSRSDDISYAFVSDCTESTKNGQNCTFTVSDKGAGLLEDLQFDVSSTCGDLGVSSSSWQSICDATSSITNSSQLVSFYSLRLPTTYASQKQCNIPPPAIRKNTLYWCARTYEGLSVIDGVLQPEANQETDLVPFNWQDISCEGLKGLSPPNSDAHISWQGLVRKGKECPSAKDEVSIDDDVFWVNTADHETTGNMFRLMLDRQIYAPGDIHNVMAVSQMATLQAFVENNNGDLGKTMGDIATSMTNLIRSVVSTTPVNGNSDTTTTVYKVGWYWLIYPASVIILGVVFFVTTIYFSCEKSRIVWKSSSLAVLAHGLDGFNHSDFYGHRIKEMSKEARDLKARLQTNYDGSLKLVRYYQ